MATEGKLEQPKMMEQSIPPNDQQKEHPNNVGGGESKEVVVVEEKKNGGEKTESEKDGSKNDHGGESKEENNSRVKEVVVEVMKNGGGTEPEAEKEASKNGGDEPKEDNVKAKEVVIEEKQNVGEIEPAATSEAGLEKSSSFKEESNLPSDLREHEKKALVAFRSKVEEAITGNSLLKDNNTEKEKDLKEEEKSTKEEGEKNEEKSKEEGEKKDGSGSNEGKEEAEAKEKENLVVVEEKGIEVVFHDIAIWGVPLLPSKADKRTDVILLKFLRARDFKVNEAFEMLRNTLQWRKQNKIDSILEEEFETDLSSTAFMEGHDREGHPVCFNVFGALDNDEIYSKTFGNEEKREKFLRWRIQLMEKGIQMLDFQPDSSVSTILQICDLKNTPLPTKKEVRNATRKAVELLQDHYPEFVAKIIFINVPFWYYAFSAVFSPFYTQRTKNKCVYARAAKVNDVFLKYIAADELPIQYGGLRRKADSEFSVTDTVKEATVKSGSTETIEIPAPEVGSTLVWDLTVCGWDVNYKEEFVPTDEGSYTIIVQKGKKISYQEGSIRNSYRNNEPGKVVITIENGAFKKKRILYRYKSKICAASSSSQ